MVYYKDPMVEAALKELERAYEKAYRYAVRYNSRWDRVDVAARRLREFAHEVELSGSKAA